MTKANKPTLANNIPIPASLIERRIYIIRGQEVMLDNDLAELYQVPTKRLNEAVKRNLKRFPHDFMFRLLPQETALLNRSQFATGSQKHRDPSLLPYGFTEHGIVMLSSVLNSERAIQMNIYIVRAFIQLRKMLVTQQELSKRLTEVEGIQKFHGQVLTGLVEDIKKSKNFPKTNSIGFRTK